MPTWTASAYTHAHFLACATVAALLAEALEAKANIATLSQEHAPVDSPKKHRPLKEDPNHL